MNLLASQYLLSCVHDYFSQTTAYFLIYYVSLIINIYNNGIKC